MTHEIYWRLHAALPERGKAFLELLYYTAQRPTEIRLLREHQIKNGRIEFKPTKTLRSTGAKVSVLITPEIQAALDRARAVNRVKALPGSHAYVIQSRDGTRYSKNGIYDLWHDARKAAGIETVVTSRDVRPYALCAMEELGEPLREISKRAAHASGETTEGYLRKHRKPKSDVRIPTPPRA